LRNFKSIVKSLKLIRGFYERLGWKEKVDEVDEITIDYLDGSG